MYHKIWQFISYHCKKKKKKYFLPECLLYLLYNRQYLMITFKKKGGVNTHINVFQEQSNVNIYYLYVFQVNLVF